MITIPMLSHRLNDEKRILDELLHELCLAPCYIYPYPIFGIAVIGMVDEVMSFYQFNHPVFWTLYRYVCEVVDVEIAEDMPTDIESEHILCSLELLKRELLLYFRRERQTLAKIIIIRLNNGLFSVFLFR